MSNGFNYLPAGQDRMPGSGHDMPAGTAADGVSERNHDVPQGADLLPQGAHGMPLQAHRMPGLANALHAGTDSLPGGRNPLPE